MQLEITRGVKNTKRSGESASYYMVCRQSRSLIFILQTFIINSPEGCPFPPHILNPIRNHKRARKVEAEHLIMSTRLSSASPPLALLPHLCKAEKWKQDTQDSAEVHAQCVCMQIQIWQRHALQTVLQKVL